MATHRLRRDLGHCLDSFFSPPRSPPPPPPSLPAGNEVRILGARIRRHQAKHQVVLSKCSLKETTRSATSDAAAHYAVTAGLVCESLGHHPTCLPVLPSRAYETFANVAMLLDSTRVLQKRDVENEKPGRLRLSLRREFGPVSNSTARTLFFFLPVFAASEFFFVS